MPYQPTSRAAYQTANLPRREAQVYIALRDHGPLTDPAISHFTKLPINVVTGARNGLVDKGLVMNSGRRQRNVASGKENIVWRLAVPGEVTEEQPRQTTLF